MSKVTIKINKHLSVEVTKGKIVFVDEDVNEEFQLTHSEYEKSKFAIDKILK